MFDETITSVAWELDVFDNTWDESDDNEGYGFHNIYQLVMGNEIPNPLDGNSVLKIAPSKNGKIKIMKQNFVGNNLRREIDEEEFTKIMDEFVSENDLLHVIFSF